MLCPICNSKMFYYGEENYDFFIRDEYVCKNSCFWMRKDGNKRFASVFGEGAYIFKSNDNKIKNRCKELDEKIEYWKENDRYLTKILHETL